jgi:hypothetical protein
MMDKFLIDNNHVRLQAFKARENPDEYFGVILNIDA